MRKRGRKFIHGSEGKDEGRRVSHRRIRWRVVAFPLRDGRGAERRRPGRMHTGRDGWMVDRGTAPLRSWEGKGGGGEREAGRERHQGGGEREEEGERDRERGRPRERHTHTHIHTHRPRDRRERREVPPSPTVLPSHAPVHVVRLVEGVDVVVLVDARLAGACKLA